MITSMIPNREFKLNELSKVKSSASEIDTAVSTLCADELFSIGIAGTIGFGVGAVPTALMPAGFTAMEGHYDKASPNYGNVIDASGSVMVAIPKFYFKIMAPSVNTFLISNIQYDGYVVHRMFINAGKEISYHFVDKYTCGKVNGIFTSKFGLDPCSTNVDHNPISALNNTPSNNYGGLYKAVKTRGNDYFLTPIYTYMGLAMLSKAQGDAGTIATCAFKDVSPYLPKGCNNNALADTNDSSVTYAASGYSNCGKTGAITNFAKTTHNGQACGVADLNGNMYEVASGFIRYDAEGFLTLKESVDIRTIMTDNTTQGSGGAYDKNLYDAVNLIDFISATETGSWQKLGNAENQVFSFSTDRTSNDYKKTMLGIPNLSGSSSSGTTAFGNDGIYRYKRNEMACRCGLDWGSGSDAGAFAMNLDNARNYSAYTVGGRASYLVKI